MTCIENAKQAIVAKLKEQVPSINLIDYWNSQTEKLTQDEFLTTPCVYLEFGAINWMDVGDGVQEGDCDITLHIVQDHLGATFDTAPDNAQVGMVRMQLLQQIHEACNGFMEVDVLHPMTRSGSVLDTDADDTSKDTITYSTKLIDTGTPIGGAYTYLTPWTPSVTAE